MSSSSASSGGRDDGGHALISQTVCASSSSDLTGSFSSSSWGTRHGVTVTARPVAMSRHKNLTSDARPPSPSLASASQREASSLCSRSGDTSASLPSTTASADSPLDLRDGSLTGGENFVAVAIPGGASSRTTLIR